MNKEKLKVVITEFHEEELPQLIEREIDIDLKTKKIIALFGPRRAGKTYCFYGIIKKLISQGLEKDRVLYINFEDDRILPFSVSDFESLLEAYYELYPKNKGKEIRFFFDEIQNVKGWETAVRRIGDREKSRIFLTGSSSKLLGREIATSLRGRTISYEILPFSFEEALAAKGVSAGGDIFYSKKRFEVKNFLSEYMKFGGFPEVVLEGNDTTKIRILQEYMSAIFFRDLVERFSIKNRVLMEEMIRYLVSNISNYFSLSGFYNLAKEKHGLTKKTIIDYASHLSSIDFVFFLNKYSSTLKEQMRNPRKTYIIDVGFRTASGFYISEDYGRVAENIVFLHLKRMQTQNPLMEIFYWKDGKSEVDFFVKEGARVSQAIQVCWDISKPETKAREVGGLLSCLESSKLKKGIIITGDFDGKEIHGKKTIFFISLWKFLLGKAE